MKYTKKRKRFEASNVSYDPLTKEAYSYNWWKFTKIYEGKLVFNWFMYSNSTRKHQYKVLDHIKKTFTKIDICVDVPKSLSNYTVLDLIQVYETKVNEAIESAKRPRIRQKTRDYINNATIPELKETLSQLVELNYKAKFNHTLKDLVEDQAS